MPLLVHAPTLTTASGVLIYSADDVCGPFAGGTIMERAKPSPMVVEIFGRDAHGNAGAGIGAIECRQDVRNHATNGLTRHPRTRSGRTPACNSTIGACRRVVINAPCYNAACCDKTIRANPGEFGSSHTTHDPRLAKQRCRGSISR
jgi:hypothetical protein